MCLTRRADRTQSHKPGMNARQFLNEPVSILKRLSPWRSWPVVPLPPPPSQPSFYAIFSAPALNNTAMCFTVETKRHAVVQQEFCFVVINDQQPIFSTIPQKLATPPGSNP